MNETSLSLLDRLQDSSHPESWERLVTLYEPLVRVWLRKYDVQNSDADDLVQEVLLAVSKDLPDFQHGGQTGAFRSWLKGILVNRLRNFWRARDRRREARGFDVDERLAELETPSSELSLLWNDEHDQYVLRQLLQMVKPHFATSTWDAFYRTAINGEKPREVAADLQLSLNAVVTAKSRVVRRLRQESRGLVDSSTDFSAPA